jgi:hypothetical protein
LVALEKSKFTTTGGALNERTILALKTENTHPKDQLSLLKSKSGDANVYTSNESKIKILNDQILTLEQDKSNLTSKLRNLKNEYDVKLNLIKSEIEKLQILLERSAITSNHGTENTPDKNRIDNRTEFKGSGNIASTRYDGSSSVQWPNYTNSMNKITSPDIKMVESTYRPGEKSGDGRTTYGSSVSGNYSTGGPTGPTGGVSNLASSGSRGEATSSVSYGSTSGVQRAGSSYGTTGATGTGATGYGATGATGYGTTPGGGVTESTIYGGGSGTYGTSSYGQASGTDAGYASSTSGYTGVGGAPGSSSISGGSNISGTSDIGGVTYGTGVSGASGVSGVGATDLSGTTGISGATGTSRYTTGTTGTTGTGATGIGSSGTQGGPNYLSTYRYNREQ